MHNEFGDSEYRPAASPELDPHHVHAHLVDTASRRLAYNDQTDMEAWRDELRRSLRRCLGEEPTSVALEPVWGEEEAHNEFRLRRVEFSTERHVRAVGWLMTPIEDQDTRRSGKAPRPTMIVLQGHSTGAHISRGVVRFRGDAELIAGDRDFGVQAVRRGYNAFVLEQRGFGERMDSRPRQFRGHYDYDNPFTDERCRHQAMVALLLERTFIGERVFDVSRAIDLLETIQDVVDTDRIACIGNSGGGSVTYYSACLDQRLAAVMPSCCVCPYADSIVAIDHCSDNYLPGALTYFDMADLAGLIAPRPLVVVAGDEDPIFPYSGVEHAMKTIRRIYTRLGAGERLAFHTGRGGHRFYAAAWDDLRSVTGW